MPAAHERMNDLLAGTDVDDVLRETFYASEPAPRTRKARPTKAKPDHYEVICISLYKEDLERLDAKVADLKTRGHRKMNRSSLIRFALDQVDATKLPRAY